MVFLQAVAGAVNATTTADSKPPLVMLLSCGVCTKKGGEGKFLVCSDGCTDPIHKDVAAALDGRGGVRATSRRCGAGLHAAAASFGAHAGLVPTALYCKITSSSNLIPHVCYG